MGMLSLVHFEKEFLLSLIWHLSLAEKVECWQQIVEEIPAISPTGDTVPEPSYETCANVFSLPRPNHGKDQPLEMLPDPIIKLVGRNGEEEPPLVTPQVFRSKAQGMVIIIDSGACGDIMNIAILMQFVWYVHKKK